MGKSYKNDRRHNMHRLILVSAIILVALPNGLIRNVRAGADDTQPAVKPCQGFTTIQASELLGVPVDELAIVRNDMLPDRCTIQSNKDFLKRVSFSLYREKSPRQAGVEMDKIKEGLAFLSKIDPLPGLGDVAFWAGNDRVKRLLVRKDNVLIDIAGPRDLEQQKIIATQLLADL